MGGDVDERLLNTHCTHEAVGKQFPRERELVQQLRGDCCSDDSYWDYGKFVERTEFINGALCALCPASADDETNNCGNF